MPPKKFQETVHFLVPPKSTKNVGIRVCAPFTLAIRRTLTNYSRTMERVTITQTGEFFNDLLSLDLQARELERSFSRERATLIITIKCWIQQ
jgi:hypothetical protein